MSAQERLLVTVAHPDDETFGCGSILLQAHDVGVETAVLCATRGEAGKPAPGSGVTVEELPEVREKELRQAAAFLGAQRVDLLQYRDSDLNGEPHPDSLAAADDEAIIIDVRRVIEDVRPTIVVTLDGSDGHRDHVRIRDATLAAAERADNRPDRVYVMCVSQTLMRQWVDRLREQNPDSEYLAMESLGTRDEDLTTVIDVSRHENRRREAIRIHASQVSPFDILPPDLQTAFLATDRLIRVHPKWTGGAQEQTLFTPPA